MTYDVEMLKAAHGRTTDHRAEIERSKVCGCFHCLDTFAPAQIERWLDEGSGTALCAECQIDSVIGDASGFPVADRDFLAAMHDHWFEQTVPLYRPVGSEELALIEAANWRAYPPRLPEQPYFYPVTNLEYARQIAREWNAKHNPDRKGYVTSFRVAADVLADYERKIVGGREHEEYWIPAEDLERFNWAILGPIQVVEAFEGQVGSESSEV